MNVHINVALVLNYVSRKKTLVAGAGWHLILQFSLGYFRFSLEYNILWVV